MWLLFTHTRKYVTCATATSIMVVRLPVKPSTTGSFPFTFWEQKQKSTNKPSHSVSVWRNEIYLRVSCLNNLTAKVGHSRGDYICHYVRGPFLSVKKANVAVMTRHFHWMITISPRCGVTVLKTCKRRRHTAKKCMASWKWGSNRMFSVLTS